MTRALQMRPDLGGTFEDPGGLVTVSIDPATGGPASGETGRPEYFLQGTEPDGAKAIDGVEPRNADPYSQSNEMEDPYAKPTPTSAGQRVTRPRESENYSVSDAQLSIEVCTLTGWLPVRGVCTRTAWRKFAYGKEPTDQCSESRHERQRLISNK
jgi:hypothetical protein